MRNMSFMLTKQQIYARKKTVTRRLGWDFLKPGDVVMACEKCQGLQKGEKIVKIAPIRITSVDKVPLWEIDQLDCIREGFPNLSPWEFIEIFCKKMKCTPATLVNRIEFEYVEVSLLSCA